MDLAIEKATNNSGNWNRGGCRLDAKRRRFTATSWRTLRTAL